MTKKDICWLIVIIVCLSLSLWFYLVNKKVLAERAEMDAFIEKIDKINRKLNLSSEKKSTLPTSSAHIERTD